MKKTIKIKPRSKRYKRNTRIYGYRKKVFLDPELEKARKKHQKIVLFAEPEEEYMDTFRQIRRSKIFDFFKKKPDTEKELREIEKFYEEHPPSRIMTIKPRKK